jgi:aryl-phospho-beta-D-glucosidase BglC (GH1 family)
VDSLEWSAKGERILDSLPVAIDQWHANVIRLPVKHDFWFGAKQNDGGEAYRKLIDEAVAATSSRGAYLALDLHTFGAPMPEHVEFWREAALRYRNHPGVLFELFNEPHGISWKVWRDGGSLKDPENKNADANAAENNQKNSGDQSVGMQALVDAARATGARNIVIAGGLDWGYDLSGVVQDFPLQEREGGNGIMYSSHIYAWKSDWQGRTLTAAEKYPIFVGEVGCQPKPMAWQKTTEDPNTWAPDMIGAIQKYKLNWTAFSFHPKCGPNAISDWNYTPTPYWGAFVKEALGGKEFELKKLR